MKNTKSKKKTEIKKQTKSRILATVLLIVIAAAIIITLITSRNSSGKPDLFDTNEKYVSGIDISGHNGNIDWQTVAQNTDFAIIRAGYRGYGSGDIEADGNFEENLKEATDAGIPVGVYFYSQALNENEAIEEAKFVLDLIGDYNVDLPVFIDYEYAHGSGGELTGRLYEANISRTDAAKIINAFCGEIEKNGFYCGVYSSSSIFMLDIKVSEINKNAYIWVADYNKSITYLGTYDIWQYTKQGSCDGINSKYVDLNYWFINSE
ncbi:MAG: glycoside hydrolase family 25 protein [Clostridiales bacterium]|nr:glycoside hydrolase family 25 protein [Clostridiales bacterium]